MRQFKRMIFLGNGEYSVSLTEKLHFRLTDGISILCGMQQTLITDPDYLEQEKELEDIVKDIAAALLGRKIKFKKRLPYP